MLKKVFLKGILISITVLTLTYIIFGFYYDRYESLITVLNSGALTPGYAYDSFFILVYFYMSKIYGNLYLYFPSIPWLNIFHYAFLIFSFLTIYFLFQKQINNKWHFNVLIIVFSIFFATFYVIHFLTMVSFIMSFASIIKLINNYEENRSTLINNLPYFILFILASAIRWEPPLITLIIMCLYYLILVNNEDLRLKVLSMFKIFSIPSIILISLIIYVGFRIINGNEFYEKIEPELEYELMSRNNFIPISSMTNKVDSMRYQAVYLGIWGDAETNDAAFLRSLVGGEKQNRQYLFENAISQFQISLIESKSIFIFNSILFIFLFITTFILNPVNAFKLLLFHSLLYIFLFILGYRVKIVDTTIIPILFSASCLYLFYLFKQRENPPKFVLFSLYLVSTIFQLKFLFNYSKIAEKEYQEVKAIYYNIENNFHDKHILLDRFSEKIVLRGFKPFQKIDVFKNNSYYIFDSQHLSTLEPYRTFLNKSCNCNANNYKDYFTFITNNNEDFVFIINEENPPFFEDYLKTVHGLNTNWEKLDFKNSLNSNLLNEVDFYSIKKDN